MSIFDYTSSQVGVMHDSYLQSQADKYYGGDCDGEPQIVDCEREFEGYDEDGNIEFSESYTYSCEECDCDECEHWKDFHEREWEEMQAALREEQEEEQENG